MFGTNQKCRDRTRFIKDIAREVNLAYSAHGEHSELVGREMRMVSWKYPQAGWLKINTDGASKGNPGLASSGGVIRDESGNWCVGFSLNIGICSAPLAELWGVYYGLYLAWDIEFHEWSWRLILLWWWVFSRQV